MVTLASDILTPKSVTYKALLKKVNEAFTCLILPIPSLLLVKPPVCTALLHLSILFVLEGLFFFLRN